LSEISFLLLDLVAIFDIDSIFYIDSIFDIDFTFSASAILLQLRGEGRVQWGGVQQGWDQGGPGGHQGRVQGGPAGRTYSDRQLRRLVLLATILNFLVLFEQSG
jgi:hypothetical protein